MTSTLRIGRKRLAQPPEIAQVRTDGLDLEQRVRAAEMQREHSDPAGLQSGEQRQKPVALERCAALARLPFPRNVQNDQRNALVPQGGENGVGVPRQRPDRDCRSEREAPGKRIVGDRKSTRLNSSHTVISYAVF